MTEGKRSAKARAARDAASTATFASFLAVIYGFAGIIAGVVIAIRSRASGCVTDTLTGDRSCSDTSHPFVAAGIAVAFGAFFVAVVVSMLAAHIRLRAVEAMEP